MNIDNLIKIIGIVKKRDKEGVIYWNKGGMFYLFYDEELNTNRPDRYKPYKKSIGAWISYEINPNYPTTWMDYATSDLLRELSDLLEIDEYSTRDICRQNSKEDVIKTVLNILEAIPKTELLKYMQEINETI